VIDADEVFDRLEVRYREIDMDTTEQLTRDELEGIRAAVAEGIADADAGRVYDADKVHAELRATIKKASARRT
jgi:predicted transcriptional regulator